MFGYNHLLEALLKCRSPPLLRPSNNNKIHGEGKLLLLLMPSIAAPIIVAYKKSMFSPSMEERFVMSLFRDYTRGAASNIVNWQ